MPAGDLRHMIDPDLALFFKRINMSGECVNQRWSKEAARTPARRPTHPSPI
jgi:hypothetical protein